MDAFFSNYRRCGLLQMTNALIMNKPMVCAYGFQHLDLHLRRSTLGYDIRLLKWRVSRSFEPRAFIGFRRTLPQNFAALIHIHVDSRNAISRSFYNTYLFASFISTFLGLASGYD